MTEASFNLIDEPWILTRTPGSAARERSIREVLASAHEHREIVGELPTQVFAITRLLLAILHRALDGPPDDDAWTELWESRSLPVDRIDTYLERYRDRFDLLHPEQPFYQVAGLRASKDVILPLDKLIGDVPVGEPFFTTRTGDGLKRMSFAEAARWVVHCQAWDPSGIKTGAIGDDRVKNGKGYPIGTGWCGSLGGTMLEGRNLRETLLLNLVPYDFEQLSRGDEDLPVWERDTQGAKADERPPKGPVDLYTWQSRRIRLFFDEHAVHGVLIANGDRIELANQIKLEPMTLFRRSKEQERKRNEPTVYMPKAHDPTRSLWRGLSSLLPATASPSQVGQPAETLPPRVIGWLARVRHDQLVDNYVARIRAIGMRYGSQSATTAEVIDDQLDLRIAVIREKDAALGRLAEDGVATADAVSMAVGNLAADIATAAGADSDTTKNRRTRYREVAYAAMDRAARAWLRQLGSATDRRRAREDWQATLRDTAENVRRDIIAQHSPSAWRGRQVENNGITVEHTIATADLRFRRRLNTILSATKQNPPPSRSEGSHER